MMPFGEKGCKNSLCQIKHKDFFLIVLSSPYAIEKLMYDPLKIKNLILDFGGVIYDISHQKQQEAFAASGYHRFDQLYSQARQNPVFADFERGHISNQDFRAAAKTFIGMDIDDRQLDALWNSILVGFVDERIDLLQHLRKHYRLFLLSNTNSIHFEVYMREFRERFGFEFESLFEKTFWSFQMGMRKPDAEIFETVMESCDIKTEQTLFIDDTAANVEGAISAGMPARLLAADEQITELFDADFRLV
ncbi:MAG: HAD family phosphatase [Clostridia bacterium]|nr:HAD family phosphatase [Clostridia bacterium]